MNKKTPSQIKYVFVDSGYREHKIACYDVFISKQHTRLNPTLKKKITRRNAIELHRSHIKTERKR